MKRFQEFSSLKINVEKREACNCWLGKVGIELLSQLDESGLLSQKVVLTLKGLRCFL